jgi:ribosomal protein L24E
MTTLKCDRCGREVEKDDSFTQVIDEEVYYFCSAECYEDPEYLKSLAEPDEDQPGTKDATGA